MGDLVRNYSDLPGTDTYWHVTLADEAFDRFTAGQPIGPISESINAGTPYLYDTGGTYPQFTYWALLAVSVVVDSTPRAFAIMMFIAMALAQLSFFSDSRIDTVLLLRHLVLSHLDMPHFSSLMSEFRDGSPLCSLLRFFR